MTTLRSRLIRLAHSKPELRGQILPLLKEAGCEKLPEGGMRDNCEKKKEEGKESASKKASSVTVRKTIGMRVRILSQKPGGGDMSHPSPETQNLVVVTGQISLDFGGDIAPDAIRFRAVISHGGGFPWAPGLVVETFQTLKTVSGGGADILLGVLKSALQEALNQRGESLLDPKEELPPAPKPKTKKQRRLDHQLSEAQMEEFRNQ